MTEPSIFTKIIRGEIPCHKVYEDELTLAFLDVNPTVPGHTLVVPKKQMDLLWDLPDEDYRALWNASKKVARRLGEAFPGKRIGVKVIGDEVPHAHVHLVPFNALEEYLKKPDGTVPSNNQSLAEMAKKLAI